MNKKLDISQQMATAPVWSLIIKLSIPAILAQVVNLLYNIVDRIYIGHIPEIGGSALTGVGLFTPILMLIIAFAMLAGAGGAPRAAIAMGKGEKDTDAVITTTELIRMIKNAGIAFDKIEAESCDMPFGIGSGAGVIFGVTGGVMEAAVRSANFLLTGEELEQTEEEAVRKGM